MAENCPEVNSFSKPMGIIRLKIKKRRPSEPTKSPRSALKVCNRPVLHDTRVQCLKRKNPFRCSPRKKTILLGDAKIYENQLFRALDGVKKDRDHQIEDNEQSVEDEAEDGSTEKSALADAKEVGKERGVESFPLDWSLKSKARFISLTPFSWYKTLTTSEESQGLSKFVRCETDINKSAKGSSTNSCRSDLFKNTMLWMHPSMPWLNLFPRRFSDKKDAKSSHIIRPLDEQIMGALQRDWIASFRSVFNILRSGCCPYFYLVANQCNILFKAPGIADEESVCVVITPTTKGLRDALSKEGISFSMPHLDNGQSDIADSYSEAEHKTVCDQESADEEDWLQSVGLDKNDFPDLESSSVSRAQLRRIDQQPSSTVVVNGSDTQALFNFLLNCKSLVANTGPLMGVPPTLLAPVAFEGATLRTLKVNQGILKQNHTKGMKQVYTLEITGPILPGCVYEVCQLIRDTQLGNFTASFSAHQLSVALNIPSKTDNEPVHKSCSPNCGVSPGQMSYYLKSEGLQNACIKELYCKDNLFKWKSTLSG